MISKISNYVKLSDIGKVDQQNLENQTETQQNNGSFNDQSGEAIHIDQQQNHPLPTLNQAINTNYQYSNQLPM